MKTRKRILSIFIAAIMLMSLFDAVPITVNAADITTISTVKELEAFRNSVNNGDTYEGKTVTLNVNLDLGGKNWTPIGTDDRPFKGTFDGQKHVIYGLMVDTSIRYCGLFGRTQNATIQNLGIENASVKTTNDDAAVLLGGDKGGTAIQICYVTGAVTAKGAAGGLVSSTHGSSNPTIIKNCYARVSLTHTGTTADVSGIASWNYANSVQVTNCYCACTGEVRPIVGWSDGDPVNEQNITGTFFDKTLSPNFQKTGFTNLGKTSTELKTQDTYTDWDFDGIWAISADKNGGYPYLRGFMPGLGGAPGSVSITVTDSEGAAVTNAQVKLVPTAGGDETALNHQGNGVYSGTVTTSDVEYTVYVNGENKGTVTQNGTSAAAKSVTVTGNGGGVEPPLFTTAGTEADPYLIPNLETLEKLRDSVNAGETYENKFIKLTADIDMSGAYNATNGVSWTPIGNHSTLFKGTFDGGSHKITGLYINRTSDYQGLFGEVGYGGAVKNLGVGGTVSGGSSVGGVVGRNSGTVTSCYNTGDVTGDRNVGGVVGDGSAKNCYNTGAVSGDMFVGGVVGGLYNGREARYCYNIGAVTGSSDIGGVVGRNMGYTLYCYYLNTCGATNYKDTPKTEAQFASGEVAWLLQRYQSEQAWGQTLSGTKDAYPLLTSESAKRVYKVAFMADSEEYEAAYANPNGTVTLPATNPTKDGYTFTKWSTAETDGTDFTATTAITEDTTVYAQFILNHTHTLTHHEAVDATCTEAGKGEYWKCEGTDGCNKMFSDANGTTEIDSVPAGDSATGHSYGAWSIKTEPTAEAIGTAERTCTKNSEHKETVMLPVLTDATVWTVGTRTEPTETADGSQEYTSEYGKVTVTIPATGHTHDWGAWSIKTEPTAEATGTAERTCTKNNEHKETVTLPVLTDTTVWTAGTRTEPTETADGSQEYTSEYGKVTVTIPALGHTHEWGAWSIKSEPTTEAEGTAERICTKNSEHKETVTLPVLTDTTVWTAGTRTEPTETTDGSQEYTSEYGTVTITIPATGGSGDNPGTQQGTVSKDVEKGENAPATSISTEKEELANTLLTDAEKQLVQDGTDIRIVLEVQDAGNKVAEPDKAGIEEALNGFAVGQYLDINLYKLAGETRTDITETEKKIRIVITVPDGLKNADSEKTRTFAVIRVHGGETEVLNDLDDSADTITIDTDRFSTYAIVYKDAPNGGNDDNGNQNDDSGNSDGSDDNGNQNDDSGNSDDSDDNGNQNADSGNSDGSDDNGNQNDDSDNSNNADNSNNGNSDNNNNNSDKSRNPNKKDDEPKTGDAAPLELYATLTMIAGFAYLLLYFINRKWGMTEETKKELVSRLIGWAKRGGRTRKYLALAAIFVLLVYYHSVGKKIYAEWKEAYGG